MFKYVFLTCLFILFIFYMLLQLDKFNTLRFKDKHKDRGRVGNNQFKSPGGLENDAEAQAARGFQVKLEKLSEPEINDMFEQLLVSINSLYLMSELSMFEEKLIRWK